MFDINQNPKCKKDQQLAVFSSLYSLLKQRDSDFKRDINQLAKSSHGKQKRENEGERRERGEDGECFPPRKLKEVDTLRDEQMEEELRSEV